MAKRAVVVGAGGISRAWFGPLKDEKIRVDAVVDLNEKTAAQRVEQYDLDAEASADLAGMLKKHQPDFVVDLTVPDAHCSVTCTALKHGCHVIGEKPMANSMTEARRMVRAAESAGKIYMVSQNRRWDPKHETVRRFLARKSAGTLTTINCDFYIGAHFGGFRAEMESPLILDMAIHHFDLCRMMTGTDPVAVYAHEFNPAGSWYAGDVAASCIFEMTDGVVFTYRGSWCNPGHHTSWHGDWQFYTDKLGLRYAGGQAPEALKPASSDQLVKPQQPVAVPAVKMPYPGQHGALREFLKALRTGQAPACECHDNIQSLAMVFAAMESSRKGRRVPVKAM